LQAGQLRCYIDPTTVFPLPAPLVLLQDSLHSHQLDFVVIYKR
jgi:hypothetical protein